jgi:hypothetical protein
MCTPLSAGNKLPTFRSVMPPSSGLSSPRIKNSWTYPMKGLVLVGGMKVKVHAFVTSVLDHLHARALTSLG